MKKLLALFLVSVMLVSCIGITSFAKDNNGDDIQNFINDSLSLINQSPEIIEEPVANNGAIQSEEYFDTYSTFETCRLIVESKEKPDELNSIGIASGFMDYHIVQFTNEYDAEMAFNYYSEQEDIISVCPDEVITLSEFETEETVENELTNTPERLDSWGAETTGLYELKDYVAKNNVALDNIVVGVVDTGIDLEHEFFKGRLVETGFNSSGDGSENSEMDKENGHSTSVSSVIVDSTPENVKVANYRVLDSGGFGTTLSITLGILEAVNDKVDVINTSIGYSTKEVSDPEQRNLIFNAVEEAYNNGIVVVAAAGNDWSDISRRGSAPADSEYCITVSATDISNVPAYFTDYGENVDVSAPGEDISVAIPDNEYSVNSGTSFSAPLTSSACAMVIALNPEYTVDDVKDAIKGSVSAFGENVCVLNLYGTGILDAVGASGLDRTEEVTANIAPGRYMESISIELSCEDSEKIYYTLDNTTPSENNGILYTDPIKIEGDAFVVKAVAFSENNLRSKMFSGVYHAYKTGDETDFIIDETGKILSYTGSVHSLLIPETINSITVTDIANGAFDNCEAYDITLPATITKLTGGFKDNNTVGYVYSDYVVEVDKYVFQYANEMFLIEMPNLEIAGSWAFRGMMGISGFDFPKLKRIGKQTFTNNNMRYAYFPELEECGGQAFSGCKNLHELYVPKLKTFTDLYLGGTQLFQKTRIEKPLDLPLVEDLYRLGFNMNEDNIDYIHRVEFSNLKKLNCFPVTAYDFDEITLVLPSTIEEFTVGKDDATNNIYKIYGTSGTLAETWAKENNFEFIEVTPETAIIKDLPKYYKSYMGELEPDIIGFNREYQWYSNTVDSNEGGIPIEGATNKKFDPADYPAPYYYCEVTSTDKCYDSIVIKTSACENRTVLADYSKLNEVLSKVPKDLSIYTPESRLKLENAVNAVKKNLGISHQQEVDAMTKDIEDAVSGLKLIKIKLSDTLLELKKNEQYTITVDVEGQVQWISTDKDVATVDKDGNITAVGMGKARVIAVVTDENGIVHKAGCRVEVELTWWQWLIYIFLFGWIWY